jgi:hypothetical protein
MGLKDLIFNKGGIGPSLSRRETIERLNPLIRQHMELNLYYNFVIDHITDPTVAASLSDLQKVARADVGKMMETVFSCGGVAFNGVELEPADYTLDGDDDAMLFALRDHEESFSETIEADLELDHQIRTKAILNLVLTNSQKRLNVLKTLTKRRRRPQSTA